MSRWFRTYDEALEDPKIQRLQGELFKTWFNLLCLASKNNGILPPLEEIAFSLRLGEREATKRLKELGQAGLIDQETVDGITLLRPHNWDARQFVSDNSSDRVAKYRAKRRASGLSILSDYTQFKPILTARDGSHCVYCASTKKLVVDHMIPISRGGTDDADNLALACRACNSGKAGRTPEMAGMPILSTSAATALARYRDKQQHVTVAETGNEQAPGRDMKQSASVSVSDRSVLYDNHSSGDRERSFQDRESTEPEPQASPSVVLFPAKGRG